MAAGVDFLKARSHVSAYIVQDFGQGSSTEALTLRGEPMKFSDKDIHFAHKKSHNNFDSLSKPKEAGTPTAVPRSPTLAST